MHCVMGGVGVELSAVEGHYGRVVSGAFELLHDTCAIICKYSLFQQPDSYSIKNVHATANWPFRIEFGRKEVKCFFASSMNGMLNVVTAEGNNTTLCSG
jgi:hypothetical protein